MSVTVLQVLRQLRVIEDVASTPTQRAAARAATGPLLAAAIDAGWPKTTLSGAAGINPDTVRRRERSAGAAKLTFGRARPPLNVYAVHAGGDSFPSGHTAAAVVVGCVLAWLLGEGQRGWVRRLLCVAAALWAVAIGVCRLYLDVHWLTDVLAGWTIGIALVCAVYLSYRWFSRYESPFDRDRRVDSDAK